MVKGTERDGKMLTTDSIKNKVKAIFIIGIVDLLITASIVVMVFGSFMAWVVFFLGLFGGLCFGIGIVFYSITNELDQIKIKPEDLAKFFEEKENT